MGGLQPEDNPRDVGSRRESILPNTIMPQDLSRGIMFGAVSVLGWEGGIELEAMKDE